MFFLSDVCVCFYNPPFVVLLSAENTKSLRGWWELVVTPDLACDAATTSRGTRNNSHPTDSNNDADGMSRIHDEDEPASTPYLSPPTFVLRFRRPARHQPPCDARAENGPRLLHLYTSPSTLRFRPPSTLLSVLLSLEG